MKFWGTLFSDKLYIYTLTQHWTQHWAKSCHFSDGKIRKDVELPVSKSDCFFSICKMQLFEVVFDEDI